MRLKGLNDVSMQAIIPVNYILKLYSSKFSIANNLCYTTGSVKAFLAIKFQQEIL